MKTPFSQHDFILEIWHTISPYVGITQSVIAFVYVLSGGAHAVWLIVLVLFANQIAGILVFIFQAKRIWNSFAFHCLLSIINWIIAVVVVVLTGGFPSLFWMLFILGAVQSGLFIGRLGAVLNAMIAGGALILPGLLQGSLTSEIWIDISLMMVLLLALGLTTEKATAMLLSERAKYQQAEETIRRTNERLAGALTEQEEQAGESALLSEMGELLQSCPAMEETHAIISHYAKRLFPFKNGSLFLYDASRDILETEATWGESDPAGTHILFNPNNCWALRRRQILWLDDPSSGMRCHHLNISLAGRYLCVPLMAQGETLGVLHLQNHRGLEETPATAGKDLAQVIALAKTVGEHIALAIANIKLREILRNQSIRDPLTGLFNRRYLEETLEREIHRAIRERIPLSLIFIDIDHFKKVNDTYGHEMGDAVLKALGEFLAGQVRYEDIPCRYGGEEFVIVLPYAPLEAARQRAEKIRAGVKMLEVEGSGEIPQHITLSLGISAIPEFEARGETLLRAADAAMYQAKIDGRDRVVVAKRAA